LENGEIKNLTFIGDNAFKNNENISGYLNFPKTLREIGNYAFEGCENISSALSFGFDDDGVRSIGTKAFYGCK
jgi:hypothetical protein